MTLRRTLGAIALIGLCVAAAFGTRAQSRRPDYPFQPVPFTSVHLNDVFWTPRIETNRTVTIPFAFQQCEKTGRVDLFVRAAKALKGEELTNKQPPGYPFDDTDVYKVIEGASVHACSRSGPQARCVCGFADREDCGGAGT